MKQKQFSGKIVALHKILRKKNGLQSIMQASMLKYQGKKEQMKPKMSGVKEIKKISSEISEIQNEQTTEKIQ